jgi:hypothetical protein
LVRTLASTVFATFDDPVAESLAAVMSRCRTVTVTIALSQLDGVAISQIRYPSVCVPTGVPAATVTAPVATLRVRPVCVGDCCDSRTLASVAIAPAKVSFARTLASAVPPVRGADPVSFTASMGKGLTVIRTLAVVVGRTSRLRSLMRESSGHLRLFKERRPLMDNRHLFLRTAIVLGIAILCSTSSLAAGDEHLIVSGFEKPESVVHDPIQDVYLVSNVGPGNPGALDRNGFISRVSPHGVILEIAWIQNGVNGVTLNGPKGMWLQGRWLYVADIDSLRIFDRVTGVPRRTVAISNPFAPNALFVNDVIVAHDGTAYVSDNRNGAIFVVPPQGHPFVLAAGPQLGGPNGLALLGGDVSWVTFFGREVRRLKRSGTIVTEAVLPAVDVPPPGFPPGAVFMDGYTRFDGALLVTSWVTGRVYRLRHAGTEPEVLATFVSAVDNPAAPDGPADISVDRRRNRLLIPLFNANQLVIVQLED